MRDNPVIQSHGGSNRSSGLQPNRRLGVPAAGSRRPVAAGRFYPSRKQELRALVAGLVDDIEIPPGERLAPAYLAPHGAYQASGPTAAHVYARLRHHADQVERVIVLGPRHSEQLDGAVAPNALAWSSPLGRTPVDVATARMLAMDGHVRLDDAAHYTEHSLEIQLPFIQVAVPHAMILPILVGPAAAEDIVVTLSALADLPGTVVIVTTDLGTASSAGRTLLAILDMAAERIGVRDACGVHALRGLIGWANHRELRAELLARNGDHVACAFVERG